jgi:molecular chaperone GrpE
VPDNPPTGGVENAAVDRAAALTPGDIESVLADFRTWLQQLPAEAVEPPPPAGDRVDLHTLVSQFTALRHEVNLQTKAVRGQQEQSGEALKLLAQTVEVLEQQQETAEKARQEADADRLRPLLKGLVELYDALSLARRELERVRESAPLTADLFPQTDEPLPELPPEPRIRTPSFWDRLLGRDGPARVTAFTALAEMRQHLAQCRSRLLTQQEERRQAQLVLERASGFIGSVIAGYTMSLQRLERLLEQHGLEPLTCVGQPFDPEQMEVLDAVGGTDRPSGEVLEEVRRGYLWRGRVFRFALVRVAKG